LLKFAALQNTFICIVFAAMANVQQELKEGKVPDKKADVEDKKSVSAADQQYREQVEEFNVSFDSDLFYLVNGNCIFNLHCGYARVYVYVFV